MANTFSIYRRYISTTKKDAVVYMIEDKNHQKELPYTG
jgi:hypothetical protein